MDTNGTQTNRYRFVSPIAGGLTVVLSPDDEQSPARASWRLTQHLVANGADNDTILSYRYAGE